MDILIHIILGVCGLLLGIFIGHLIDKPKLKQVHDNNIQLEIEREQARADLQQLISQSNQYQDMILEKGTQLQALLTERDNTQREINLLKDHLNDLTEQQTTAAEAIFESAKENAQNSFDQEMERLSCNLQQCREDINKAYLSLLEDAQEDYQERVKNLYAKIDDLNNTAQQLEQQLENERNKVNAAVEAAKRSQEIQDEGSFYKLSISMVDQVEIKRLREILPYLRDKEPLNKVIYKCYYEKPYTDLVGRVIGQQQKTGIYKITNIKNQMCYVGQAVNIAERWRQHIKRGVGAEAPTRNKLYPAMYEIGPENFTFEVLEECTTDKLNEREQYWQDFYHAKDWGYSIK